MYVILTSKPGQFRTEITEGLKPLEAYDYLFYGEKKAHFVIAELVRGRHAYPRGRGWPARSSTTCLAKFLEKFEIARARLPGARASDDVRSHGNEPAQDGDCRRRVTMP